MLNSTTKKELKITIMWAVTPLINLEHFTTSKRFQEPNQRWKWAFMPEQLSIKMMEILATANSFKPRLRLWTRGISCTMDKWIFFRSKFKKNYRNVLKNKFSNFSCRFLNPNNFFQFELVHFSSFGNKFLLQNFKYRL